MFQSPLHWGIAFNFGGGGTEVLETEGFSPLFIGASRSTVSGLGLTTSPVGFQSPLHWGIAFNLKQEFLNAIPILKFQSPLHWGIAFNVNFSEAAL